MGCEKELDLDLDSTCGGTGMAEVKFLDCNTPLWKERDGLLVITGGTSKKSGFKMKVWWHHSYLRRKQDSQYLVLEVAKAWIQGIERKKDNVVPANFRLTATFEHLHPEALPSQDYPSQDYGVSHDEFGEEDTLAWSL